MSEIDIDQIIADPDLLEQLQKLVLERVNIMPNTLRMSVGSDELDKKQIVQHVQDGDATGRQIMEMELEFLRDLASGRVYAE